MFNFCNLNPYRAVHRYKADEAYMLPSDKGPVAAYLSVNDIVKIAKDQHVSDEIFFYQLMSTDSIRNNNGIIDFHAACSFCNLNHMIGWCYPPWLWIFIRKCTFCCSLRESRDSICRTNVTTVVSIRRQDTCTRRGNQCWTSCCRWNTPCRIPWRGTKLHRRYHSCYTLLYKGYRQYYPVIIYCSNGIVIHSFRLIINFILFYFLFLEHHPFPAPLFYVQLFFMHRSWRFQLSCYYQSSNGRWRSRNTHCT